MQFVHHMTRLACDMGRAYRLFTHPKYACGWVDDTTHITAQKDALYALQPKQANGQFLLRGNIVRSQRERQLVIEWREGEQEHRMTIDFMGCRSDTEYCTEIHIRHEMKGADMPKEIHDAYKKQWARLLEAVRTYQNKDWVIQDKDLTSSWLRGGGL